MDQQLTAVLQRHQKEKQSLQRRIRFIIFFFIIALACLVYCANINFDFPNNNADHKRQLQQKVKIIELLNIEKQTLQQKIKILTQNIESLKTENKNLMKSQKACPQPNNSKVVQDQIKKEQQKWQKQIKKKAAESEQMRIRVSLLQKELQHQKSERQKIVPTKQLNEEAFGSLLMLLLALLLILSCCLLNTCSENARLRKKIKNQSCSIY